MIRLYDLDTLFEEVAFVAYHFGWSHDEVLSMAHWERRRWCAEISAINERANGASGADGRGGPGTGGGRGGEVPPGQGGSFIGGDGDGIVIRNSLEDR